MAGLVSSAERVERAVANGADATIDRTQDALTGAMRMVPNAPDEWDAWEAASEPLLEELREKNDAELADHVVSHAGAEAFSRSYQVLEGDGQLSFNGASTGYEMAFMGKGTERTPGAVSD
jgi:acrylyl-CoA reductase (NADPH)/3-hydroxypropionyl-CoA dehydratase/3-hydroxypropionyl-CoA synthetase